MVKLNKIYTRTGDGGDTGLATGERVLKDDARVAAYGDVDETNACLGLARLHAGQDGWLDAALGRIQNELFDLGADLATPERDAPLGFEPLRVTADQVARLEQEIDQMNEAMAPLNSFVLPAARPSRRPCTWLAPSPAAPSAPPLRCPAPRGKGQPRRHRLSEPLVRPPVRGLSPRQRERRAGRPLGPRARRAASGEPALPAPEWAARDLRDVDRVAQTFSSGSHQPPLRSQSCFGLITASWYQADPEESSRNSPRNPYFSRAKVAFMLLAMRR
jgi:hypothetical protein